MSDPLATLSLAYQVVTWLAVAGLVLAVGALGLSFTARWALARKLARYSTIACGAVVALLIAFLVYGFNMIANVETSSKATLLAMGISTMMNCTAALFPALVIGGVVSLIARRKLR